MQIYLLVRITSPDSTFSLTTTSALTRSFLLCFPHVQQDSGSTPELQRNDNNSLCLRRLNGKKEIELFLSLVRRWGGPRLDPGLEWIFSNNTENLREHVELVRNKIDSLSASTRHLPRSRKARPSQSYRKTHVVSNIFRQNSPPWKEAIHSPASKRPRIDSGLDLQRK